MCCLNGVSARAWIYLAIQDQLLQCYLTQLTEDRKLLSKFYKADAAICDQEMMFSISSLFSGLEVMTFDISVVSVDPFREYSDQILQQKSMHRQYFNGVMIFGYWRSMG